MRRWRLLYADFETYCDLDIKKVGAAAYAAHPSMRVLVLGYAFDDEEPQAWFPGNPFPERLSRGLRTFHNAMFDRLIWEAAGLPEVSPYLYRCTAAKARSQSLPGKLSEAAKVLGLSEQKGTDGPRLIKKFCHCRLY